MDAGKLNDLLAKEFTIAGATFRVRKMNAEDGFILEMIRSAVADPASMNRAAQADGGDTAAAGRAMIQALMSVSPEKVRPLRIELLKFADVKLPGTDRFVPVKEVYPVVMDLIEAIDNYELMVRIVAVNFTQSFRGLMSRLGLSLADHGTAQAS